MEPESPFQTIRERLSNIDKSLCVSPPRFSLGGGTSTSTSTNTSTSTSTTGSRSSSNHGHIRNRSRRAIAPLPLNVHSSSTTARTVKYSNSSSAYQTPEKNKKQYSYPTNPSVLPSGKKKNNNNNTTFTSVSSSIRHLKNASHAIHSKHLSPKRLSNMVKKKKKKREKILVGMNDLNQLGNDETPTPPSTSTTGASTSRNDSSSSVVNTKHATNMTRSRSRGTSSISTLSTSTTTMVEFQSVLRIRPFTDEEWNMGETRHIFEHPCGGDGLEYNNGGLTLAANKAKSCSWKMMDTRRRGINGNNDDDDDDTKNRWEQNNHMVRMHNLDQKQENDDGLDFHFDSILGPECHQDETYETIGGRTMTLDALNPILLGAGGGGFGGFGGATPVMDIEAKHHVIISMGVSNSGKTFTIFGPSSTSSPGGNGDGNSTSTDDDGTIATKKKEEEGIVPRLIDDLFLSEQDNLDPSVSLLRGMLLQNHHHDHQQSSEKGSTNPQLELELSMIHLHNDHIYDMLTVYPPTTKKKKGGKRSTSSSSSLSSSTTVSKMIASFEIGHGSKSSSTSTSTSTSNNNRSSGGSHSNNHNHSSSNNNPTMPMKELKIFQDRRTQDFVVEPTVVSCTTSTHARDVLRTGLMQNTVKSTKLNKTSSRGHTLVTLRPVLKMAMGDGDGDDVVGGSITILDLAGIENTKQSAVLGPSMRESVSINTSISAMMQCLRSIKNNQERERGGGGSGSGSQISASKSGSGKKNKGTTTKQKMIVPYRENKLTKLMQPLFSGRVDAHHHQNSDNHSHSHNRRSSNVSKVTTVVQMFVSVYPGMKDYHEKKSLLQDIDSLRGLSVERTTIQRRPLADDDRSMALSSTAEFTASTSKESLSPIESQAMEMSLHNNNEKNPFSPSSRSSCVDGMNLEQTIYPMPNNIEATPPRVSKKTKQKMAKQKSPLQLLTSVVKPNSGKKRKAEIDALNERIQMLEEENAALKETKGNVMKKCQSLSVENKRLKTLLRESEQREREALERATMAVPSSTRRDLRKDEDDFQRGRTLRRGVQNLIPSPIVEHMKKVEQTKTFQSGKVGHFLFEKPPFPFEGPAQRRLREEKEREEAELLTHPKDEWQKFDRDDEYDIMPSESMESASA